VTDPRIVLERDDATGIARLTIDNAERRNCYDPAMREQMGAYLDDLAFDDAVKVVLLRGAGGIFSTGADMGNAYSWYEAGDGARRRRPSQRRRLSVDRRTFGFYHDLMGYPKVTVAEVRGFALGGGLELALMADIAVVARDTVIGPVLARRLLLTGDTVPASTVEHLGVFTEVADDADVAPRAQWWAQKAAKMPADGIVMAKEAFRLVEQLQAYQGEEVASYLFHAFGTNLQFEDGEFNFVKARAEHGTKRAFELRDAHFDVPEPR
jgi:enoyl-CoA hydratase/carnithine racemase